MGFNFEQIAETFQHRVEGRLFGELISFIAVFKIETEQQTEEYIKSIARTSVILEHDPSSADPLPMRAVARDVFVGWVNPPGFEDDWITMPSSDGGREPVDSTPEAVEQLLARQGMSRMLVMAYIDAVNGGNGGTPARLGNSESLRGKPPGRGFPASLPKQR